jgi:phenylpyruvate tautomerase PptA (4-oxalocrotonate tautomerase family)
MPVYTVVTSTSTLSDQTKATVAAEITKTHAAITGPIRFIAWAA